MRVTKKLPRRTTTNIPGLAEQQLRRGLNNKHQHYADPREFGIRRKKWPTKQPTRRAIDRSSSTPRIERRTKTPTSFSPPSPNTRRTRAITSTGETLESCRVTETRIVFCSKNLWSFEYTSLSSIEQRIRCLCWFFLKDWNDL